MSRSGYTDDDDDQLAHGRWRGIVASTIRGKRGQAFLREMLAALDAMPNKRLIRKALVIDGREEEFRDSVVHGFYREGMIVGADELVASDGTVCAMGEVCAMGAVAKARGLDVSKVDPEDPPSVAHAFDISEPLAQEIAYLNDEADGRVVDGKWVKDTPEWRWQRMRDWVASQIREPEAA